jgi:hypothetical protein
MLRETTDYLASILDRRNSRTCCFWLVMIQASHLLLQPALVVQVVYFLLPVAFAIVSSLDYNQDFVILNSITVNSIVLLTNGISFALQAVVLLMIGAWADYGTWRYISIPIFPEKSC